MYIRAGVLGHFACVGYFLWGRASSIYSAALIVLFLSRDTVGTMVRVQAGYLKEVRSTVSDQFSIHEVIVSLCCPVSFLSISDARSPSLHTFEIPV